MKEVLEEIETRIKRLEAEIELIEERLKFLDRVGATSKYQILQRRTKTGELYIMFFVIWGFMGLTLLLYLKYKYSEILPFSLTPYIGAMMAFIIIPFLYYFFLSKQSEPENPINYLEKKERMARLALNRFYIPLKEALKHEKLKEIANRLLQGEVADAITELNEGDPKVMAYALYLYLNRDSVRPSEINEVVTLLKNKPLKKLLLTISEEKVSSPHT
ncbi:hypothetical protein [Thermococcus sp.]|uniref:hypothetical protein n=1 Tax=Thermococcus sp. TaxID=35749 RepID=UPI001994D231|nr:hypothetical protein [Thermococcus sp.]MBC7095129.1 hypothetical protein [Thermococcus sp.]